MILSDGGASSPVLNPEDARDSKYFIVCVLPSSHRDTASILCPEDAAAIGAVAAQTASAGPERTRRLCGDGLGQSNAGIPCRIDILIIIQFNYLNGPHYSIAK
jgi:hypothetical protein